MIGAIPQDSKLLRNSVTQSQLYLGPRVVANSASRMEDTSLNLGTSPFDAVLTNESSRQISPEPSKKKNLFRNVSDTGFQTVRDKALPKVKGAQR